MKEKKQTTIIQDYFDKGFVKAVNAIQQHGKLRNESLAESELHLQHGRLYEIKRGMRHVPKKNRDHILKYLMQRFDVNPNIFLKNGENVFNTDPPSFKEDAEDYEVQRIRATAGDLIYIEKLESDVKHLSEENLLLRKLVASLEGRGNYTKKSGK